MTFQAPPPEAPRTSNDTAYAGYIDWKAQGSAQHNVPPASWMIRNDSGTGPYPAMATGVVWDIENIETGWQIWPDGGKKEQIPNPAVHQPLPHPGQGYSEYVKIPMAQDQNTAIIWDQASTGSWKGFCQIAAVIAMQAPQNPGMLPVIRFAGATLTSTGKNSTQVPNFEVVQWVPRPPCLMAQQAPAPQPVAQPAPFAPQPQPAPQPMPQPQPAPAPQPQQPMAPAAPVGAWGQQ
tara:strand:- start:5 stop:709 length:705 start_codon:yes stop_codon:yes gene_type:complete